MSEKEQEAKKEVLIKLRDLAKVASEEGDYILVGFVASLRRQLQDFK